MQNYFRAIAFLFASFLVVCNASAAPYDPNLGTTIDNFLSGQSSPLFGLGSAFFTNGVFYDVDPRLIVAIAGLPPTSPASCG